MIIAVTVAYHPNLDLLERQIRILLAQVDRIVLLHNGPTPTGLQELCNDFSVDFLGLESNIGLASAQNRGIVHATKLGAHEILLMDQDSVPYPQMVSLLSKALLLRPDAAAVGPRCIDLRSGHRSHFLVDNNLKVKVFNTDRELCGNFIDVAVIIASGTLLRTSALSSIGLMRGKWFIDRIDTEWCFRARLQGWKIIAVPDAHLGHSLGDKVSKFWWGRKRQVPHHSPLRHYYVFRNTILLNKLAYVPFYWKIFHLKILVQIFLYFILLAPERSLRLKMMVKGLYDGFTNSEELNLISSDS